MSELYARIHTFLQQQSIMPLLRDVAPFPDQQYMKAGVVPFVREDGFEYMLMKPLTHDPLNPPAFQICKGTRMYLHRGSGWRDMKAGDEGAEGKETLPVTALREGIEELGLPLEMITKTFDVGPYKFTSERTGKNKYMWLYALEMGSKEHFLPLSEIANTTADRAWLRFEQFDVVGREDHRCILQNIEEKLQQEYSH